MFPENQIQFECSLHQQRLEQVQSAKYLGITITDNFDWGQHVSEISCKATKTIGFLRRNLALATRHTKEVAFNTLVRPQIEYAAPIWHPYHDTQIAQVEKVQRTAARWTCRPQACHNFLFEKPKIFANVKSERAAANFQKSLTSRASAIILKKKSQI